jgi:molybdopterin synthase catalytic subunit
MVFAHVTSEPIDAAEVLARVGADEDGAVLLFLGVVRNHAEGRAVAGMRYDAYEAMAGSVLGQIAREASERHGTDRIAVVHRVGDLLLGETSVAIAVSTPHRAEAYAANREIIEEIKKRLPVWKKEHYVDGASAWVEGVVPPVGDRAGGTS